MKQLITLLLVLLFALPVAGISAPKPDKKKSCKYKIAAKKKEIRKKQRVKEVPYYARLNRSARKR